MEIEKTRSKGYYYDGDVKIPCTEYWFDDGMGTINVRVADNLPQTEMDLWQFRKVQADIVEKELRKTVNLENEFPNLDPRKINKAIAIAIMNADNNVEDMDLIMDPYNQLLEGLGFKPKSNGKYNSDFYIEESLDENYIENIVSELFDLRNNVVIPELVNAGYDYFLSEIKRYEDDLLEKRRMKELAKNIPAGFYIVHTSFRNGFLDTDRKPAYVNSLNEIDPKNVSWLDVVDNYDDEEFESIVADVQNSGVAHVAISNGESTFLYIPIIKIKKIIGGKPLGDFMTYTYNVNSNRWIPMSEAKSLSHNAIKGASSNRFSRYSSRDYRGLYNDPDIVSKSI